MSLERLNGLMATTLLALMPLQGFSMPDKKAPISKLTSQVDTTGVGEIVGDHEKGNVLYLIPGDLKFKGKFSKTAGNIDCQDLRLLRKAIYRMPEPVDFEKVFKSPYPFSTAFDSTIGVQARTYSYLNRLNEARMKVQNYIQNNKQVYGDYKKALTIYEKYKLDQEVQEAKIRSRMSLFTQKISVATDQDEREALRAELKSDLQVLNERSLKISQNLDAAAEAYSDAYGPWAPFKDQLEWLQGIENSIYSSYQRSLEIMHDSFAKSSALLNTLESKVVGNASAGFSLNNEKRIELLRERIRKAGLNYQVQSIDLFNVQLNPGVTKFPGMSRSEHDEKSVKNYYDLITYSFDKETKLPIKTSDTYKNTDYELDGKKMQILVSDIDENHAGSQAYEFPVNLGAYCGDPKEIVKEYHHIDDKGKHRTERIRTLDYSHPTSSQYVFVQNIPLSFNYHLKAEPIEGSCKMNIKKAESYFRSSGRKKSWRWFKRITRSWNTTRASLNQKMGVSCSIQNRPSDDNDHQALEKMLYDDMFSMFLMQYAKDYKITGVTNPGDPELIDTSVKAFSKIGSGMASICGANAYCQVGGVVLKSLSELMSQNSSGTSSSSMTFDGEITRTISKDSFYTANGFANVELRVCIDASKCEE